METDIGYKLLSLMGEVIHIIKTTEKFNDHPFCVRYCGILQYISVRKTVSQSVNNGQEHTLKENKI